MMKKLRILVLALAVILSFGLCACTPRNGAGQAGQLKIIVFKGGYNDAWLKKLAAEYKAANPQVSFTLRVTVAPAAEIATIEAGTAGYDIYFMIDNMFQLADRKLLADLTPVYDYVEEGQDKKVKEKMNPIYEDCFKMEDGKYYMMPWSNSQESLIYNKTVVDEYFPEGLDLPRTTDEMFEICDKIKEKGLVAFNYSGINDYLPYMFIPFWAQYEGLENYYDYYEGFYKNENGERVFSKDAGIYLQQGRKESINVLERLCKKSNGYTHPNTNDMDFMKAQLAFLGHGYSTNKVKSVFSLNGEWLENEMSFALKEKAQEIRFAKLPVISAIKDKTKTINDDATLRKVVDFCDGVTDVKPSGVSEEDIEYVSEARRMVNSVGQDHNLAVYKHSKNVDLAIDFLKFMTTKKASEIYAKELGGMTLPFGSYDPLADESLKMSGYIRSKHEQLANCIPIYQARKPTLVYRGGHCAFGTKFGAELFSELETGEDILNRIYKNYNNSWKYMVNASGLGSYL